MSINSKQIAKKLNGLGMAFEIEHVRPMSDVVILDENGVPDNMMSRDDFNKNFPPGQYGENVSPVGGFTRVVIIKGDEQYVGKHNFGRRVNFNKQVGFVKAAFRAAARMGVKLDE